MCGRGVFDVRKMLSVSFPPPLQICLCCLIDQEKAQVFKTDCHFSRMKLET